MAWKIGSTDGQLSLDNMNVAPVKLKLTPDTLEDKIQKSYRALRLAADMSKTYYGKPLIICYSGGKDSDVMLRLAEECLDIKDFEVLNSHTTLDAPPTVRHIEKTFKRINDGGGKAYYKNRNPVKVTIWDLMLEKKFPPMRNARYCCAVLKETGTPNRLAALGVRAAESTNRQGREMFGIRGGGQNWYFFRLTTLRKCIMKQKIVTQCGTAH